MSTPPWGLLFTPLFCFVVPGIPQVLPPNHTPAFPCLLSTNCESHRVHFALVLEEILIMLVYVVFVPVKMYRDL